MLACGASTVSEVCENATEPQMRAVFRKALEDNTLNAVIVRTTCT